MVFQSRSTWRGVVLERLRRFLDLQYASIYRDIAFLARRMRGDVLDVGCGAQPFRHLLAGKCIYRGIDSSGKSISAPAFPTRRTLTAISGQSGMKAWIMS